MPFNLFGPEFARLSALFRYGVLDTPAEPVFDRLVADLAASLDAPMAQLVFADLNRMSVKASVGLPATELARTGNLLNVLIEERSVLDIPDIREGCADRHGALDGVVDLRSFLGIRMQAPGEDAIGALFVADRRPRTFDRDDHARLEAARDQAMLLLESRRRSRLDFSSGALRRDAFIEQIAAVMGVSRAAGQIVSLLTLDLAAFRARLDRASSGLGRLALLRVRDLGREQVRQHDSVGRLDEDFFAVLLSDTDQAGAQVLKQRLMAFLLDGWDTLTPILDIDPPTIGIATWHPGQPEDPQALLDAALGGRPPASMPQRVSPAA